MNVTGDRQISQPTAKTPESKVRLLRDPETEKQDEISALWKSTYLKRTTMLCFAILFAATIAALEVVYSYSQTHHRLCEAKPDQHHLWTYISTACKTMVDFRVGET